MNIGIWICIVSLMISVYIGIFSDMAHKADIAELQRQVIGLQEVK